jgi:hypothetical protein
MNFSSTFVAVLSMLSISTAIGQESPQPIHNQTTLPTNARFEIVQSSLVARLTFRLDRYTGRVWQLVKTQDDENAWEETPIRDFPSEKPSTRPRYQLFTSGIAARLTFLLDTDTGKTWVVIATKAKRADGTEYDQNVWKPFTE